MSEKRARFKTPWADESTITLRGLRVAWAPERVVPWAELVCSVHDRGGLAVRSVDRDGEPLRVEGRRARWLVAPERSLVVAAMVRRGQKRALESGRYAVTVRSSRWTPVQGVVIMSVGLAGLGFFVVSQLWPHAAWLCSAGGALETAERAIELAVLAVAALGYIGFGLLPIVLGWSFACVGTRCVTLTAEGLAVTDFGGRARTIRWDDVVSIRGGLVWRIRTKTGETVSVLNTAHAHHVLLFHRRRLHGEARPLSRRLLLLVVFVAFQIVGVINAVVLPGAGTPAWRAYVLTAWVLPLMMMVPVGVMLFLLARVSRARSSAERRQRRRGINPADPRLAPTRHPAATSPPPQ